MQTPTQRRSNARTHTQMGRIPVWRALVVVAAGVALAGLVGPADATPSTGAAPAAVPPTAVAPAAVPYTRVTLTVYGCNGCTVRIQRALKPGSLVRPSRPSYWGGVGARVVNGVAVLRIPTAWTPGSSLTIQAPWMGEFGFMPNVVTRYYGYAPRSYVNASQAAVARAATACWAGTTRSTASMVLRVAKAGPARDLNGNVRYLPRAWAYPTLPNAGNVWQRTSRGVIGTQDAFYC